MYLTATHLNPTLFPPRPVFRFLRPANTPALVQAAIARRAALASKLLALLMRVRQAALSVLARIVRRYPSDTEWCAALPISTHPKESAVPVIKVPASQAAAIQPGRAPLALVTDPAEYARVMALYNARVESKGQPHEAIIQRAWNSLSAAAVLAR